MVLTWSRPGRPVGLTIFYLDTRRTVDFNYFLSAFLPDLNYIRTDLVKLCHKL